MIYSSNDSNPTIDKTVSGVLQPGTSKLIIAATRYAYELSLQYPYGIQDTMVVLLDKHRYKFKNGLWYRVGNHYAEAKNETLLIPLPARMLEIIRAMVTEQLPELIVEPLAFSSLAVARQIAKAVLPKMVWMELESLRQTSSNYESILFDGLLRNWIGFDINNPTHEKIALATKLVFLSFVGGQRTPNESLELIKTELGFGTTNGSRAGTVFFHEHIGGVYFMAKTSLSYCVCLS